jgi:hypothetical protein
VGQINPGANGTEGRLSMSAAPSRTQKRFRGEYSDRHTGQLFTGACSGSAGGREGLGGTAPELALGCALEGESLVSLRRRQRMYAGAASALARIAKPTRDQAISELCRIRQAEGQKKPGRLTHPGFFLRIPSLFEA